MSAETAEMVPTGRTYSLAPAKQLGKQEAKELEEKFKASWDNSRQYLLDLFEGKAHKARGFGTWEEYCQEALGINSSERTINNHLAAARVERVLMVSAKEDADKSEVMRLPLTSALELNKLDKSEIPEAYKEFKAFDPEKKKTASEARRVLNRIVLRRIPTAAKVKNTSGGKIGGVAKEKTPIADGLKVENGTVKAATYSDSDEAKQHDAALANGEILESATVASSEEPTITISLSEYGKLVSFVRRFVQSYGSDGEAMGELRTEIEAYLVSKEGDGSVSA